MRKKTWSVEPAWKRGYALGTLTYSRKYCFYTHATAAGGVDALLEGTQKTWSVEPAWKRGYALGTLTYSRKYCFYTHATAAGGVDALLEGTQYILEP